MRRLRRGRWSREPMATVTMMHRVPTCVSTPHWDRTGCRAEQSRAASSGGGAQEHVPLCVHSTHAHAFTLGGSRSGSRSGAGAISARRSPVSAVQYRTGQCLSAYSTHLPSLQQHKSGTFHRIRRADSSSAVVGPSLVVAGRSVQSTVL